VKIAVTATIAKRIRNEACRIERVIVMIVIIEPASSCRAAISANLCTEEIIDWADSVDAQQAHKKRCERYLSPVVVCTHADWARIALGTSVTNSV
jgi:hypothetical protein